MLPKLENFYPKADTSLVSDLMKVFKTYIVFTIKGKMERFLFET